MLKTGQPRVFGLVRRRKKWQVFAYYGDRHHDEDPKLLDAAAE